MASRSVLIIALLLASSGVYASAVPDGYQRIARQHGVPPESLYSVALAESSKRLPHGERPWPWTLNVAGKGYRYNTRLEAWQALQVFMKKHPLKRIDVGVAQVNLGWNGHHFSSTWDALEPYTNLNAAATILRNCYDQRPGSWLAAAGCYHHPAGGKHAARYTAIVKRKLETLNRPRKNTGGEMASIIPESHFIWTEPRSL